MHGTRNTSVNSSRSAAEFHAQLTKDQTPKQLFRCDTGYYLIRFPPWSRLPSASRSFRLPGRAKLMQPVLDLDVTHCRELLPASSLHCSSDPPNIVPSSESSVDVGQKHKCSSVFGIQLQDAISSKLRFVDPAVHLVRSEQRNPDHTRRLERHLVDDLLGLIDPSGST